MLKFTFNSIFHSDFQNSLRVNPVNCYGVMGAGLAKEFKFRFPENFTQYRAFCFSNHLKPGEIFLGPGNIANFATKDHWKNPSRIEWIQKGLDELNRISVDYDQIVIPKLGCGFGGLEWGDVLREIKLRLISDCQFVIC